MYKAVLFFKKLKDSAFDMKFIHRKKTDKLKQKRHKKCKLSHFNSCYNVSS